MKTVLLLSVLCLGISGGCLPLSVHSLYSSPGELVYETSLEGVWSEDDETELWELRAGDDGTYSLTATDTSGKVAEYRACLIAIGDALIMQVSPTEEAIDVDENIMLHLGFLHSFHLVKLEDSILYVASMDLGHLKKVLNNTPTLVEHTVVASGVLLTATTARLREFMTYAVSNEGFFEEFEILKRVQE